MRITIPVQGIVPLGEPNQCDESQLGKPSQWRSLVWGRSPPDRPARLPSRRLTTLLADFYAGFLMVRNEQEKTGGKDGLLGGWSSVA